MAIDIVVIITVREPNMERFVEALAKMALITAEETGCNRFEIYKSEGGPRDIILVERWFNQDAIEAHMAQPYTADFIDATRDMVEATRLIPLSPLRHERAE